MKRKSLLFKVSRIGYAVNMESATKDISELILEMGKQAKAASYELAVLDTERKNDALTTLADLLIARTDRIIAENGKDLEAAETNGIKGSLLDRLKLDKNRIAAMAEGVRDVVKLEDPVGDVIESFKPENGLDIRKVRVPLGVIGIIYESRPDVTIDCATLCLKSGNASLLRGGTEAVHSNRILADIVRESLKENGINANSVQLIPTTDRGILNVFLRMDDVINCIIPRGGEALIRFVTENSTIPVIKHYKGVCSIYVHKDADPDMAVRLVVNSKTNRPGVCNAAENLFIHKSAANELLPLIAEALSGEGVILRLSDKNGAHAILDHAGIEYEVATESDFSEEYLDLIISIQVVDDMDDGIAAINHFGSAHSDSIITEDPDAAESFMNRVDSATIYWNASTRFTDGNEFGFGAEIGISTDKLHARGPMGLKELCSYKFKIYGQGQVRGA